MKDQFAKTAAGTVAISGLTEPMREWLEADRGSLPHLDHLLRSEAAKAALPGLFASGSTWAGTFSRLPPLLLAGHIAQHLYAGGAYAPNLRAAQAAHLADEFVQETIGERYEDFHVAESGGWSEWFYDDDSWNAAWAITDLTTGTTILLCATDTD